jgi:hypothetical protein
VIDRRVGTIDLTLQGIGERIVLETAAFKCDTRRRSILRRQYREHEILRANPPVPKTLRLTECLEHQSIDLGEVRAPGGHSDPETETKLHLEVHEELFVRLQRDEPQADIDEPTPEPPSFRVADPPVRVDRERPPWRPAGETFELCGKPGRLPYRHDRASWLAPPDANSRSVNATQMVAMMGSRSLTVRKFSRSSHATLRGSVSESSERCIAVALHAGSLARDARVIRNRSRNRSRSLLQVFGCLNML